jgi:hypothetical protein
MLTDLRALLNVEPEHLLREALGLAGLVAAIVAGFCLPALA